MTTSHELAKLLLESPDVPVVLAVDAAKDSAFAEHDEHPLENVTLSPYDNKILVRQYVFDTKIEFQQFPAS